MVGQNGQYEATTSFVVPTVGQCVRYFYSVKLKLTDLRHIKSV